MLSSLKVSCIVLIKEEVRGTALIIGKIIDLMNVLLIVLKIAIDRRIYILAINRVHGLNGLERDLKKLIGLILITCLIVDFLNLNFLMFGCIQALGLYCYIFLGSHIERLIFSN